jgi:transcriptional regulator with XRE-family HTH domain
MKFPSDNLDCTRFVDKYKRPIFTHRGFNAHYSLRMTNDDYKKEIGRRIAATRNALGWSLQELADKAKMGRSRIGNYEAGERMPGPAEINALGLAMGVSGAYLMCLEDGPQSLGIEDLPPVFQEAIHMQIAKYREIAISVPAIVLDMFKRPTSENYATWEAGIEESYRNYAVKDAAAKYGTMKVSIGKKPANQKTKKK